MAKILSTATTITVSNVPYPVPATRSALLIGTNTAASVAPSIVTAQTWSYATMEDYGSGAFVRDFSNVGAFVVAGCGGHHGPGVYGGLIFDFETARWSWQLNTNGMPLRVDSVPRAEQSSIGEITISGVTGPMPAPAHLYRHPLGLSTADGGGTKGSLLLATGCYSDDNATIHYVYAYRFDLATSRWSRFSSNRRTDVQTNGAYQEGSSVHDAATRRVYLVPGQIAGYTNLAYLDIATQSFKTIPRSGTDLNGLDQRTAFVDAPRNQLVQKGSNGVLYGIDLRTGNGPTQLSLSGSLPAHNNRWDYYPVDGCWYSYAGDGSQSIDKLTPPAGTSAGTWTCSKVAISGAALAPRANATGAGNAHYTRFFYVPGLQCFAWVPDVTSQVALIKP